MKFRSKRPVGRERSPVVKVTTSSNVPFYSSRLSGREAQAVRNPARSVVSKKYPLLRKLPLKVTALIILVTVGYLSILSTTPKLISVNGTSDFSFYRNKDDYQKSAEKILGGSIFNRDRITIDTVNIENEIMAEFPELGQVSVSLPVFGRHPVISIVAKQPAMALTSQQGVFVLDANGVAMVRASNARGFDNIKLPIVNDESSLNIEVGKGVLTSQQVEYISVLVQQLNLNKKQVSTVTLPPVINQVQIKLKGFSYFIKFDMQNDPKTSAGAFIALSKRLAKDGATPAEYVDVRIEDRAFYR
jgi:hypothetical protein